jgi:hypothetical protein
MSLKRGFKAEANRISLRLRARLGLSPHAPIDLNALARDLHVPIVALSAFAADFPEPVRHLTSVEPGAFSAATVPLPNNRRVIVHNDTHSRARQRANISHELAHLILEHPFTLPIDSTGIRNFDRDIEDEANWLGPVILISDEAALHIVREAMDTRTACTTYEVSGPLLRMRINSSGARIRIGRRYN